MYFTKGFRVELDIPQDLRQFLHVAFAKPLLPPVEHRFVHRAVLKL